MGFWLSPGVVDMPVVTAPMTGRTVGATTSFAVAPKTSGAGGKPVLPVFGRPRKDLKCKKCKHKSEWVERGNLRVVEAKEKATQADTKAKTTPSTLANVTAKPVGQEKEPTGLGQRILRRAGDRDEAEIRIKAWHRKHNLPWPGVRNRPLGTGKVIDLGDILK